MTIKEIIDKETTSTDRIFLHKEGLFWKLYERSAFWFVHNVHPFKATKRFVKSVGQEVVTIGFPVIAFEKYAASWKVISKEEHTIILDISGSPQQNESFNAWKESLSLTTSLLERQKSQPNNGRMVDEIIRIIRHFDIANSTPLECMHCITEMKRMANQI